VTEAIKTTKTTKRKTALAGHAFRCRPEPRRRLAGRPLSWIAFPSSVCQSSDVRQDRLYVKDNRRKFSGVVQTLLEYWLKQRSVA
jgi:hypothetical protein